MVAEAKVHCSFCHKHKNDVDKLIVGEGASICNECVDFCQGLLVDPKLKNRSASPKLIDPRQVKTYLDRFVIGQEPAKIALSVAVANHYKRIGADRDIVKSNILMLGPSGSGKTLLVKTVAKFLDVPIAIGDATSMTEAGYAGEDVESVLGRLLTMTSGDVKKAEKGIIFIDEIDKIARRGETAGNIRDVSGEGVQQGLLKIVEGTVCRIPTIGTRKQNSSDLVEIDTSNILFIIGGAFIGIEDIIRRRDADCHMGFTGSVKSDQIIPQATAEDLIAYGMIPEFVGRFGSLVCLSPLDRNHLEQILVGLENNLIDQYRYLCACDDVELAFEPAAIDRILDLVMQAKTGARALSAELERVMRPHLFNLRHYRDIGIHKLIIDQKLVDEPCELTGETHNAERT